MKDSDKSPLAGLVTLKQAASELPYRREGRPTSYRTLYRWYKYGYSNTGIHLRTTKVGVSRCTKPEWLQEFFDAIDGNNHPAQPSKRERDEENEWAVLELKRLGL